MSWRGLDHRTIYEMVVSGGAGVGVSMDAEAAWDAMHGAITRAEQGIAAAIRDSESGWLGAGAEAARSAYSPLGSWAQDAALDAQLTASGVRGQATLAAATQRHVAGNAPPQNFLEYLHDQVGSFDGHTIYDEQAQAVDRLMQDYELASADNTRKLDYWTVPPTVAVTVAAGWAGGVGGSGGGAGVPTPDTSGLAVASGGAGAAGQASTGIAPGPLGVGSAGGSRIPDAPLTGSPGAVPPAGAALGTGPGTASTATGSGAVGARGIGRPPTGGSGAGGSSASTGSPAPAPGSPGLATGGAARPADRIGPAPGGRGSGPGPWTRSAPPGPSGFRPVVPAVPPRPVPSPGWRSVLLPPEPVARDSAGPRTPGESRAGTPVANQNGSSSSGAGARATTTHGMYPPMAGAGGGQSGERRRPSFLVDDSDAFVDRRWVQPAVITPEDLLPDEHGRLPGQ